MWIVTVLTSEFFWGVIVGLVLSVFGAYCLAVFAARQQKKAQKDLIRNFCIDTVNNLKAIVDDMVDHRQPTQVIHSDYLQLLDIEFNVFGRNFVTVCAIRKAEIGTSLATVNELMGTCKSVGEPRSGIASAAGPRPVKGAKRQGQPSTRSACRSGKGQRGPCE
jgi:hypothetical protein